MPGSLVREDPHRRPDAHLPGVLLTHLIIHTKGPDAIHLVTATPGRPHPHEVPSDIGECLPNSSIGISPPGEADGVDPLRRRRSHTRIRSSPLRKGPGPRRARLGDNRVADHRGGPSEPGRRLSRSAVEVEADDRTTRWQTLRSQRGHPLHDVAWDVSTHLRDRRHLSIVGTEQPHRLEVCAGPSQARPISLPRKQPKTLPRHPASLCSSCRKHGAVTFHRHP